MGKKTAITVSNPYTAPKLLFYFSKGSAGEQPFTDPKLIDPKTVNNSEAQATPSGLVPPKPANQVKPTPDDPQLKMKYSKLLHHSTKTSTKKFGKMELLLL